MAKLECERIEDAEHPLENYVDVEVSGVATADGECFTVEDDTEAEFFSVYLRTREGFAECVADVHTRANAESIANGFALLLGIADGDDDDVTSETV